MFKGLRQGDFAFSGLTLFVGPHGVGKSSLRDVFRFLHGIGRGYSLSEIAGERWGEGGTLEWSGIRGGPGELSHFEQDTFSFSLRLAVPAGNQLRPVEYSIEVQSTRHHPARMVRERLVFEGRGAFVFDSHPDDDPPLQVPDRFAIRVGKALRSGARGPTLLVNPRRPALSQLALHPAVRTRNVTDSASCVLAAFRSLRFLEPTIQAMCRPSLPDQLMLGDHGENLSSVLLAIVQNQDRQQRLLRSMRDFSDGLLRDIDFIRDATGRVLLVLVDRKGARLSAYSASEGVLRFLTLSAALLGPECPGIWFMDNLDAGFGPSKLNLVLRHLEEHATTTSRQLMATMRTKDAVASLDLEPDGPSTAYELLAHASGAPQRMGTTQVARTRSKKTDESEEDLNEWLPF
jgi:predicted ATPase